MAEVTITLTTIPSRFDKIGETLECLVAQKADVREVRLNVPHRFARFPDYDGHLPDVPSGVTIHRPAEDMGPATKVLPTIADHRATPGALILLCDDDRLYPTNWAADFVSLHHDHPDKAICISGFNLSKLGVEPGYTPFFQPRAVFRRKTWDWDYRWKRLRQQWRARTLLAQRNKPPRRLVQKAGHVDIFEGVGGVLVQPRFFDARAFDIPLEGRPVDDVWLSAILARNNVPIWSPADRFMPEVTEADQQDALFRTSFDGKGRAALNLAAVRFAQKEFGIWTGPH